MRYEDQQRFVHAFDLLSLFEIILGIRERLIQSIFTEKRNPPSQLGNDVNSCENGCKKSLGEGWMYVRILYDMEHNG